MKRNLHVWLLICSICFVVSCSDSFRFSPEPNPLSEMKCYKTFEEFAYTDFLPSTEKWLPTEPWHIQATMPNEYDGEYAIWNVQLVRYVDGSPEIWLKGWRGTQDSVPNILVYQPLLDNWISISDQVEESDILVRELYVTNDGDVWGRNDWSTKQKIVPDQGSVLSKYNEETNQFEFASGVLKIPYTNEEKYSRMRTLFDHTNNVFWIAIETDGLYTYEPDAEKTIKQIELHDMPVGVLTSATDGTIYFASIDSTSPTPCINAGMIMRFSPKTQTFTAVENPVPLWPFLGPPLVTKSDHLWIGSIGYMDLVKNKWNLLVDPSDYYVGGYVGWPSAPQVILEDEFGIVWFEVSSEGRGGGMAWYDPKTDEGCMFTNRPANIVEDERQNLWMFADGNLYRLSRGN